MHKVLDKFGIYDLVGVLLSGISICTFSLLVLQLVYNIRIDMGLQINKALTFIVLSYFVGLIFQELSSLIQKKITFRNNALLKQSLNTSEKSHILLTQKERDGIYSYVKIKLNLDEDNDNVVYNYCKFYVIENYDTTRIDKDQSLSAMSRSLSLYFLILSISVLITAFINPKPLYIFLIFLSALFSVLLHYRCIRFAKLRYIYIFRTFYYNVVVQNNAL